MAVNFDVEVETETKISGFFFLYIWSFTYSNFKTEKNLKLDFYVVSRKGLLGPISLPLQKSLYTLVVFQSSKDRVFYFVFYAFFFF